MAGVVAAGSVRGVDLILSALREATGGSSARKSLGLIYVKTEKSLSLFSRLLRYSTLLTAPGVLKITAPLTGTGLYSWQSKGS